MFKPMLASNIKIQNLRFPVVGSKKMEGVRGEFTPSGLLTRPMKKFNNKMVQLKFAELVMFCREHNVVVEGEFYMHGMVFSDISSICRRADHPDTDKLQFHVFDMYVINNPEHSFTKRVELMQKYITSAVCPDVYVAEQYIVKDKEDAFAKYEEALDQGYEGYVFKCPNAPYKTGRSTANEQKFVRIKPENTYDGVVIDIVERMENLCESEVNELGYLSKKQDKDQKAHTGLAAVAIVDCPDFKDHVRVSLTRGIKDFEHTKKSKSRQYLWEHRADYIGKHLKFVGLPVPGMDLPRSPRFDEWRTDLDH